MPGRSARFPPAAHTYIITATDGYRPFVAIRRDIYRRRPDDQRGGGVRDARSDHLERRGCLWRGKFQPHDRRRGRDELFRPLHGPARRELLGDVRRAFRRQPYVRITATDNAGNSAQHTGTFVVGPMISQVMVSVTQGTITWNVAAAYGVASSSLTIDGAAVTNLFGPYTAPPGVNYSGTFSTLSAGSHTYAITATDDAGNSTQRTGTFVVGPMISQVVVSVTQGTITWNVAAAYGVAGSSLTIDGAAVDKVDGPYTAPPGVNYAAVYGVLQAGEHSYTITAIDDAGNSTQYVGTFTA